MKQQVELSTFHNEWYKPGKNKFTLGLWYFTNAVFFKSYILPISSIKIKILQMFGAKVGKGVVIKPNVNIKYPWKLRIGDYTWIGEEVWIDNLAEVNIGDNCCLSQGSFLLCGNHDYAKRSFDLMVSPIILEEGCWVGAKSTIAPGSILRSHSIVSAVSFFSGEAEAYFIYAGNPAKKIRERRISEE